MKEVIEKLLAAEQEAKAIVEAAEREADRLLARTRNEVQRQADEIRRRAGEEGARIVEDAVRAAREKKARALADATEHDERTLAVPQHLREHAIEMVARALTGRPLPD